MSIKFIPSSRLTPNTQICEIYNFPFGSHKYSFGGFAALSTSFSSCTRCHRAFHRLNRVPFKFAVGTWGAHGEVIATMTACPYCDVPRIEIKYMRLNEVRIYDLHFSPFHLWNILRMIQITQRFCRISGEAFAHTLCTMYRRKFIIYWYLLKWKPKMPTNRIKLRPPNFSFFTWLESETKTMMNKTEKLKNWLSFC